jgi:hypothetical protein
LKNYCEEVNKTGVTKELRFLSRSLRQTFARLRRKLTAALVGRILAEQYPECEARSKLARFFPAPNEVRGCNFSFVDRYYFCASLFSYVICFFLSVSFFSRLFIRDSLTLLCFMLVYSVRLCFPDFLV